MRAERARPVIIDTDCGVDDALALWYALLDPALDVVAITTVSGNTSSEQAGRNVAKILEAAGRTDIPLSVGDQHRLGPAPDIGDAEHIHGRDGLGDAGFPDATTVTPIGEQPAELIVRLASERPGELTLVPIGPFTNVARALALDPRLPTRLADLVAMGGVAVPPGNATPYAEFNAVYDPEATRVMVDAAWPQPPLLVGLDVTNRATMGDAEYALVAERRTPAARFLEKPLAAYRSAEVRARRDKVACHDVLAVMAVAHPDVLGASTVPIAVDVGGSAAWGATVVDLRPGASTAEASGAIWRVALEVDVAQFRQRLRSVVFGG